MGAVKQYLLEEQEYNLSLSKLTSRECDCCGERMPFVHPLTSMPSTHALCEACQNRLDYELTKE